MSEQKAKELCLAIMRTDSEAEVINLLKQAGYWERPDCWRFYGDYENNYNTIGNQQSRPDSALVEKLINAVDARLMNHCLVRGMDPEAPDAPQGIQEAVALFFDDINKGSIPLTGGIRNWTESKRTEIARGITLVATGAKPESGSPCFTITDMGEGQTPSLMPVTLLSLNRSNKLRIPFVQGKFNMGGTGVLKFSGKYNLQLIISRRNPEILQHQSESKPDDNKWCFTVVRRENPQGNRRSSVYTYLASMYADTKPNHGEVLRFFANKLPIFPDGKNPYGKEASWGTLIKLYEYSATGFKSHILMKDGLLGRIDLLLPEIALPMRFYESRDYKGHEGSFETTLTGVRVRLEDDKGQNLEEGFPVSAPMKVSGEDMMVMIYAFKKKRSEAYRKNEGIIFIVNGQTHGYLTQNFFTRGKIGLSYISDSILVIVDCTRLSGRAREDLFMNSRDRLSRGELRQQIEESLEELLKQHIGLRALQERRRREEIESKLDDAKPLEKILEKLLKQSPILSHLFLHGLRASTPFKTIEAQAQEQIFQGSRFPTYFKFRGKDYDFTLKRDCNINMRCRLTFETDAESEYFSRAVDPGEFYLYLWDENTEIDVKDYVLNLQNGIASLSLPIPKNVQIGQILHFVVKVNDCSRIEPFSNTFYLTVKDIQRPSGQGAGRRKPPGKKKGGDRERPSGIKLPTIVLVKENEWSNHNPPFDKYTAMRVVNAGSSHDAVNGYDMATVYDFFINMGNLYLKNELKTTKGKADLVCAQFKYGMVLVGLGLLQQDADENKQRKQNEDESESSGNGGGVEKNVERFSRAIAPVIIPMINSLGSLTLEDEASISDASGEAT